jgi:predicted AAA+ superfamily ATPase
VADSLQVLYRIFVEDVIKLLAIIDGLFLAGLTYLQYHQIANNINWSKLQTVLEDANITLTNLMTQIQRIGYTCDQVCYQFFKELRKRFGRKIKFTDGARWYNEACIWLRLKHLTERFLTPIKPSPTFIALEHLLILYL